MCLLFLSCVAGALNESQWHRADQWKSGVQHTHRPQRPERVGGHGPRFQRQRPQRRPRAIALDAPPGAAVRFPAAVLPAAVPSRDPEPAAAAEPRAARVPQRRSVRAAAVVAAPRAAPPLQPADRAAAVAGPAQHPPLAPRGRTPGTRGKSIGPDAATANDASAAPKVECK